MPITPMGGKSFGFWHIPDVGEWVHVRFDHGRLEHPMWEGGWWGNGDCTPDMNVNNVVLCTKEGLKLVFHRDTKQIEVTQKSGNVITIGDDSITLNHHSDVKILSQGNIEVTAQGKVSITAPEIDLTGAVKITGDVHLTGAGVIVPAPWSTPV
jgi:adhesin HecA-like repeat protein